MTGDHENIQSLVYFLRVHPANSAVDRPCNGPLHIGGRALDMEFSFPICPVKQVSWLLCLQSSLSGVLVTQYSLIW